MIKQKDEKNYSKKIKKIEQFLIDSHKNCSK